jgi:glucose/arabinose dehydrogenase
MTAPSIWLVLGALLQGGGSPSPPAVPSSTSTLFPPVIGASAPQTPLTTQLIANGLSNPVAILAPKGDYSRLFVLEQNSGRIRIVKQGVLLPTPFLDLGASVLAGGEQGLLGMAFHPNYAQNGRFFVDYTTKPSGDTVIMAFKASATNPDLANPASGVKLLQVSQPFANHKGGALAFGPDGYLYIGFGDGGSANDPYNNAQSLSSLLGKILRINVDAGLPYSIPPTNPFVGVPGAKPEIWAYGLRNPWKFVFDRAVGDLYIADVGQDQWEEIDFQPSYSTGGENYGWRCFEGKHGTGLSGCSGNPQLEQPIYEYNHAAGCAVIGGGVYRGFAIPDLRGTYFFADWCKAKIWSFDYQAGILGNLTDRTLELTPNDGISSISTVSSFGEDGAGEMYIADYNGGEIFKIIPAAPVPLFGVTYFGTGTPGCAGVQHLTATQSPIIGNPFFALKCDAAPKNSADFAGGGGLGLGVTTYIDFYNSNLLLAFLMPSDSNGNATLPVPIPLTPFLAGNQFFAQVMWYWAGQCAPPPNDVSSSTAVELTILP